MKKFVIALIGTVGISIIFNSGIEINEHQFYYTIICEMVGVILLLHSAFELRDLFEKEKIARQKEEADRHKEYCEFMEQIKAETQIGRKPIKK